MQRADALVLKEKYSQAETIYRELEYSCAMIADRNGVAESICQHALVLLKRKDHMVATKLYEKAAGMLRGAGNDVYLERILMNKALGHLEMGDLGSARKDLEEGIQLCKKTGSAGLLVKYLKLYGPVLGVLGDSLGAQVQQHEREIIEQALGKNVSATSQQEADPTALERFRLLLK
jgi:hypothetical protein